MFLLNGTLADSIIFKPGNQVWFFSSDVLVFLLVPAVAGFLAESGLLLFLVRCFLPLSLLQGQSARSNVPTSR